MLIDKTQIEGTMVVRLNERRLTADIAQEFSNTVVSFLNDEVDTLILDLEKVDFMDSSGLGSVISIKKQSNSRYKLLLCSINSAVMEILKLTRMNQVLDIYEDLETAKAA